MNGRETGTSPSPDKEKPVAVATDRVTGASFSVLFRENPASGREISIRSREVPLGLLNTRMESGYLLSDGCVLLESEKDADGNYIGGAGINGMYFRTSHRYRPVLDGGGNIRAFRDVSEEGVLLAVRQDGKRSVLYRGTRPHCEQILREKAEMEDFFARRTTDKPGMYYLDEKHDWNWEIPSPPRKEKKIMKSSAKNIKLASYDDIFKTDEEKRDAAREKVQEIPLSELYPFRNHPFQVRDDDSMKETAESIKKYGVLVPAIARPRADGGYELISGHRRKRGCELAGKETMPVIVRELDDDAATIIMVDYSNLQRENILPSERALAYKMKLDALKHQGQRTDLTSRQVVGKLEVANAVGETTGESGRQVQRYIRLTALSPELLQMVDDKKIAFNPAVELSYLKPEEQALLLDEIEKQQATPSLSQAQRLKKYSQEGKLDANVMDAIMTEEKQEVEKITLHSDRLKKYFPKSYTPKQMEETIYKLLEQWQRKRQRDLER